MGHQSLTTNLFRAFLGAGSGSVSPHTYDTLPDNDDIALVSHGTADTFGDQTAIVTSVGTSRVWLCGALLSGQTITGSAQDMKIDISTGASGSETSRIVLPWANDAYATTVPGAPGVFYSWPFPLHVPSGTRLAGRVKAGLTAGDINIVIHFAASL